MLDEKEKTEQFLEKFTAAGRFVKKDNVLTIEPKEALERAKGKQGYLLFCVDGEIKHIAECFSSNGIADRINEYRRGGNETNGTYQRVNDLINCLAGNCEITAHFVECSKEEDYKEKYKRIFHKPFDWCWENQKRFKPKKEDEAYWEKVKQDYNEELILEKSENIRFRETISRERSHEQKINALHNSGNECLLNPIEKCTTFLRRYHKITCNDERYLEVHHLIPLCVEKNRDFWEREIGLTLAADLDVAENMVCLCSNCHNKLHYGRMEDIEPLLKELCQKKKEDLLKIGVQINLKQLKKLYKILN